MRIMGLDLGTRTIGVAVSDETGLLAQGVETIRRRKLEQDVERIKQIVEAKQVERIVLGYPKNMNGTIGERAQASEEFKALLEEKLQLPVVLWDERLTTVAAQRVLIEADIRREKRKKVIDMLAAVVILQNYLDSSAQSARIEGRGLRGTRDEE